MSVRTKWDLHTPVWRTGPISFCLDSIQRLAFVSQVQTPSICYDMLIELSTPEKPKKPRARKIEKKRKSKIAVQSVLLFPCCVAMAVVFRFP